MVNKGGLMKKLLEEFQKFIERGNVIDMAVGVIMANAIGKVTTSLVNDVIMPVIGMFIAGTDLGKFNICIREAEYGATGEIIREPVNIGIGTFLTTVIDFIIVAFIVFIIVKTINSARDRLAKIREVEEAHKGQSVEALLSQILEETKKHKL